MKSRKAVLIVGGSGFVGTHLAIRLRENFKVFATYSTGAFHIPGVSYFPMDIRNRDWIKRVVYSCQPHVIIYVAGREDVEWAEQNSKETELIHSSGPVSVLTAAEILTPKFIYISSPYVFDGDYGNFRETSTPLPWTQLGKNKLRSENFIRGKSMNYVLVRSAPLFGRGNGRHLSWMDHLRIKLEKGVTIEMPNQEIHAFAPVYGLTELVERLVDGGLKNRAVHYGGLTKMTQYQFAIAFAKRFGYDASKIIPRQLPTTRSVTREIVYDYSLNCSDTIKALKTQSLLIEEGFDLLEKRLAPTL